MKKNLTIGLILIGFITVLFSCNPKESNIDYEQIVKNYYAGFNTGDFNLISKCASDSVTLADNDYVIAHNKTELYLYFQWDSVFQPKYEISDFKKDSCGMSYTVSKFCKRIEFLQDSATIYRVEADICNNQIVNLKITDHIYFNNETWTPRRDSLIAWIDNNHPELSGFFTEESFKGAVKFSKAIDLYRNEK